MTRRESKGRGCGLHVWMLPYCAYFTAGLLCGDTFPKQEPLRISRPRSPNFEEDGGGTVPGHITWRNFQVLASFANGGVASIRSGDGSAQISFVGADVASEPVGESRNGQKSFYYVGHSSDWRVTQHFERVRYAELYPGIDLVFVTKSGQLEYNFEVAPGADPSVIRIRFDALTPSLSPEGNLNIGKGSLKIVQRRPQAY